ncbi:hypothetical protein JCM14467A_05280 [Vulcanisaeta sp. JCM 14467]
MIVPKAVIALGGCYIFTNINLTSTGFPYSVVFYTRISPSRFARWPPITAGLFNKTIPITLSERAPQVSISFLNETINYVSPNPPFFYTAKLTATWSYAVYPINITNYIAYAQLGPWFNITMINNSCKFLRTYVVLRPVPTIINARPDWLYFSAFIVILVLLIGALSTIIYLLLIKPMRRPTSNSSVPLGIYRFGRGMLIFLVTSIINIIMTITFLMSSILTGSSLMNPSLRNPSLRKTMATMNSAYTASMITDAIVMYVAIPARFPMVNRPWGVTYSRFATWPGTVRPLDNARAGGGNVRIGYYGSLVNIFGIILLMIAYPAIFILAEPFAVYAIEHVTPSITPGIISAAEGLLTAAILALIGIIILFVGFIMTIIATYRLLTTYSPTTKYLGAAIALLMVSIILNLVGITGVSLGIITYAPAIAYLYYLTTLALDRIANFNDIDALMLSAERELDMARVSTYPIDNLRRAFNYAVKALAIREGLPETQDAARTGYWTNQLITSAVMRLSDKLPTVKELWLSLSQGSVTNIDETINKVKEILKIVLTKQ